jgi:hypothetical protein
MGTCRGRGLGAVGAVGLWLLLGLGLLESYRISTGLGRARLIGKSNLGQPSLIKYSAQQRSHSNQIPSISKVIYSTRADTGLDVDYNLSGGNSYYTTTVQPQPSSNSALDIPIIALYLTANTTTDYSTNKLLQGVVDKMRRREVQVIAGTLIRRLAFSVLSHSTSSSSTNPIYQPSLYFLNCIMNACIK